MTEAVAKIYLFNYRYQGAAYTLEVPADNRQEAEERLKVMPWGKYDGILIVTIPVIAGNWLPSLICRIRHWFTPS